MLGIPCSRQPADALPTSCPAVSVTVPSRTHEAWLVAVARRRVGRRRQRCHAPHGPQMRIACAAQAPQATSLVKLAQTVDARLSGENGMLQRVLGQQEALRPVSITTLMLC